MKRAARIWLGCCFPLGLFGGVLTGCLSPFPAWEGKDPSVSTDAGALSDGGGASVEDAGTSGSDADAGKSDGGVLAADAGNTDAGGLADGGDTPTDAGAPRVDAGSNEEDGGPAPNEDGGGDGGVGDPIGVDGGAGVPGIDGGVGTEPNCDANQHAEDGTCVPNLRMCTVSNGMGQEVWEADAWGPCTLESCDDGFHDGGNGTCVANTRTCEVTNGTGSETWSSGAWGECTVTGCNTEYHIENNACAANTISCDITNGTGTQTWEGSAYGVCSLESCEDGFHDGGDGTCVTTGSCASGYFLNGDGACDSIVGGVISGPHGMEFAVVPKGTFTMGSPMTEPQRDQDETQHNVEFTYDFAMGFTEVTQGEWKAESAGTNPSSAQTCGNDCPVEQVDWYSALAYANALSGTAGLESCYTLTGCDDDSNGWQDGQHSGCTAATFVGLACSGYRLPTEAEWEYAYRAGTTTAYYSGEVNNTGHCGVDDNLDPIGWYCGNSKNNNAVYTVKPVRQKAPNAWRLYDMPGNVWEWTWDWHGTYPGDTTDYAGPTSGSDRVVRGGSSGDQAYQSRAAYRLHVPPNQRSSYRGFRLVRTLD